MLVNDVNLDTLLQEDCKDHESEFNWKRGFKIHNKTTYFALPFIDLSVDGNICGRYIRNAYIDDMGIEHDFIRPLFVLFRVRNLKEKPWADFCKLNSQRDVYITDYYVGQEGEDTLVMYVFQVPEKWGADYQLFKMGQYSQMSGAYKSKFPQYSYTPSGDKREMRMWGILNKSEALKDEVVKRFIVPTTSTKEDVISLRRDMNTWDEIWDAPQLNAEIFRYVPEKDKENDTSENSIQGKGTSTLQT